MSNKSNNQQFYRGVGRRKTSTAVVRLFDKKGEILVNGMPISDYFSGEKARKKYMMPFDACGMTNKFSGDIRVSGGGTTGQLDATVLGISRALLEYDEELKAALKKYDLLTRDPRMKERKKVYHRGARRKPQFSKR
ncbi:MAG: 30S ribosomal protein S9 [Patescibacteria group bacterium]|nr:30S ribosomal protein S9 [Patescibacteria group bacterium]